MGYVRPCHKWEGRGEGRLEEEGKEAEEEKK